MSFLLCCLLSNEKNVERNIEEQIEGIQTTPITNVPLSKNSTERINLKQDTLIDISEFEKCQYWFIEILKHVVYKYIDYGKNKRDLSNHIFKFVDLNKTVNYFKKYHCKYNNYNQENIIEFCKNKSNEEFINDIKIAENIYRFHY